MNLDRMPILCVCVCVCVCVQIHSGLLCHMLITVLCISVRVIQDLAVVRYVSQWYMLCDVRSSSV